ncbi:MAG: lysophospholipid acyltransferase family protein [Sulfurospirillaceae bacterium]|nr:lysophospholipid acyltransferase family protein [Sulfurospirillaceae bacterium]
MKTIQRGSGWSIKLVYTLYKVLGYRFIYYLMYPVSYFYYLKASNTKEALQIYYDNIGQTFGKKVHHEHLRHFSICMSDRFISLTNPEKYDFVVDERKLLEDTLREGGILLLSHYGGWASAANCLAPLSLKINIVMQESLMQSIQEIEESIRSDKTGHVKIIDISKGGIAVTIEIANALRDNELVAMMADRATNAKNSKKIEFFGKAAKFNKNPFEIAYKTKKPLIALFVRFVEPLKYKIEYKKIEMDWDKDMDSEVDRCMQMYVDEFAKNIEIYPQGWFNFYDFWEK